MLRSYEAIYDHGQLRWLKDAPKETPLRVIVTVIEEASGTAEKPRKRRRPPPELAGAMRLLGDDDSLLEPAIPEEEWDALK